MCSLGCDGLGGRGVWLVPLGQHQRLFSPDINHGFAVSAGESPAASPNCSVSLCDKRRVILICHPLHWQTEFMLGKDLVVLWRERFHNSKILLVVIQSNTEKTAVTTEKNNGLVLMVSAFFDYLLMFFHISFLRRWPRMAVISWW